MSDPAEPDLETLREILRRGQKLSGQGSYKRRAPHPDAHPHLVQALKQLVALCRSQPDNADAWLLRSEAHEALLQYPEATQALERAVAIAGPTKRTRKKLAHLRELVAEWAMLMLTPSQLHDLGQYLESQLAGQLGERDLHLTRQWLGDRDLDVAKIIQALENRGAFSDFEVLANIVR
jgi:tetratricopeptide (TPR) repeat protein